MLAFTLFPLKDSNLKGWSEGNSTKNRSRENREANGILPLLPFNTREKTQRQWLENSIFITCNLYFRGSSGSSHLKPTVIFQILSPWLVPWGNYAAVFFWTQHTNQMIWLWAVEWKWFPNHFGNFPSLDWVAKTAIVISPQAHLGLEFFTCIFKWLPNSLPSDVHIFV